MTLKWSESILQSLGDLHHEFLNEVDNYCLIEVLTIFLIFLFLAFLRVMFLLNTSTLNYLIFGILFGVLVYAVIIKLDNFIQEKNKTSRYHTEQIELLEAQINKINKHSVFTSGVEFNTGPEVIIGALEPIEEDQAKEEEDEEKVGQKRVRT